MSAPVYWPAPVSFEDAPVVIDLSKRLRYPDAAIFALRLWHHRRRCGAIVTGDNAVAVVEGIARWRRRAGLLVEALMGAGIVERCDEGLRIRAWEEIAAIDWTRTSEEDATESPVPVPVPFEDPKERRRRLDRERKARKPKRNDAENSADVPHGEAEIPHPEAERSAVDAEGVRNEAERGAETHSDPRTRMCATKTKTKTKTGEEPAPVADAPAAVPAPLVASHPTPDATTEGPAKAPASPADARSDADPSREAVEHPARVQTPFPAAGFLTTEEPARPLLTPTDPPARKRRAEPKAPADPQLAPDRAAYLARFRALFNAPNADFTRGGVFEFQRLRAKHGMHVLTAALEGCAADDWTRGHRSLAWVCSQDGIDFGTRARTVGRNAPETRQFPRRDPSTIPVFQIDPSIDPFRDPAPEAA